MAGEGAVISGGSFDSTALTGVKNLTLPYIEKELRNAVYTEVAYLKWMDRQGGIKRNQTGNGVYFQLTKSKDTSFDARYLRDPYPLDGTDTHRQGYEDFGEYSGAIVLDYVTKAKNSGKEQLINYMTTLLDELKKSARDSINTGLLTGSGTLPNVLGLDSLIPETVATGTMHGIDRADNPWWRPTATDSSCSTTDGAGLINIKEFDKLIKDISEGQGMNPINMAVCDSTVHNNLTYYGLAVPNSRYIITNGGNVPATGVNMENDVELMIGNAPLIWDTNAPSDSVRLFSTSNVNVCILKNCDFKVLPKKFAEDSFSSNIPIGVVLAHINKNPKRSGVLYNFNS